MISTAGLELPYPPITHKFPWPSFGTKLLGGRGVCVGGGGGINVTFVKR